MWGGFVIRTKNEKGNGYGDIYFAGDSGYGPFLDRIAAMYPEGFRFGIIPIGAYQPSFMMREVHMSPDEAVEIFKKLKVKRAMGIHFGTFKLADDGQFEPVERLKEIMNGSEDFVAIKNGTSLSI